MPSRLGNLLKVSEVATRALAFEGGGYGVSRYRYSWSHYLDASAKGTSAVISTLSGLVVIYAPWSRGAWCACTAA